MRTITITIVAIIISLFGFAASAFDKKINEINQIVGNDLKLKTETLNAFRQIDQNFKRAIDKPKEVVFTRSFDGFTFDTINRLVYEYDSRDTLLNYINQDYQNGSYVNNNKVTAVYAGNFLARYEIEIWDDTTWQSNGNLTFTYNLAGKLTKLQIFNFAASPTLTLYAELRYYFDSQNYLTNTADYFIDFTTLLIAPTDSAIYTNNTSGSILTIDYFLYNDIGNFDKDSKEEYAYDNQQRNNKITYQDFNLVTQLYENSSEETFSYTGSNKNYDSGILKLWDGLTYENDSKIEVTYNLSDKVTSEVYSLWNGTVFENSDRFINTYTSNGLSVQTYEEFDAGNWIILKRDFYNYGTVGINFQISKKLSGKIFPNPATDKFNLQINSEIKTMGDLTIIDLSGRIIYSQNLIPMNKGKNTFMINEDLKAGIYLVNLKTKNANLSEKLIIK